MGEIQNTPVPGGLTHLFNSYRLEHPCQKTCLTEQGLLQQAKLMLPRHSPNPVECPGSKPALDCAAVSQPAPRPTSLWLSSSELCEGKGWPCWLPRQVGMSQHQCPIPVSAETLPFRRNLCAAGLGEVLVKQNPRSSEDLLPPV